LYDIIGDIHGHADELIELLELLGYRQHNGSWSHSTRWRRHERGSICWLQSQAGELPPSKCGNVLR